MVRLVFRPDTVAGEVADDLRDLRIGIAPGPHCRLGTTHVHCIDKKDLAVLARARREWHNRGGFARLYPVPDVDRCVVLHMHAHAPRVETREAAP